MAALLASAGHGDDQTRARLKKCAFGPCLRYDVLRAAQGGAATFSFEHISKIVQYDFKKRVENLKALDLKFLAAELVVAGLPVASGGTRKDFTKEVTQAIMKLAVDGTLDPDTLAESLNDVTARNRHVAPTGTYVPSGVDELSKVLCLSRLAAVAAAALPPKPAPAKHAKGKGSPTGPQVPAAVPPTTIRPPGKTGATRRVCDLGASCRHITVEWDPDNPGRTRMVTNCACFHHEPEYKQLCTEARNRLAPASSLLPAAATTPASSALVPHITSAEHVASLLAFKRTNQPDRPACMLVPVCTAVRAAPTNDTIQTACDEYNSALAAYAADERSIPSSVPSARLTQFCADHRGMSPRQWHHEILRIWEAYLASLAADLPPGAGAAFLATTTAVKKVFLLDTGSGSNLGPHRAPSGPPGAPGATSVLRAAHTTHRVQTAGGGAVSLHQVFDSELPAYPSARPSCRQHATNGCPARLGPCS